MAGFFAPNPKPNAAKPQDSDPESEAPLPSANFTLDTVEQWRYDHLLDAGYSESQALFLAIDKSRPDLHEAVALADKAGPDLAYQIIST